MASLEDRTFAPGDTWESVAARLGTDVDTLLVHNAGLGGATTAQSVPVSFAVHDLNYAQTQPVDSSQNSSPVVELETSGETAEPEFDLSGEA